MENPIQGRQKGNCLYVRSIIMDNTRKIILLRKLRTLALGCNRTWLPIGETKLPLHSFRLKVIHSNN